MILLKTKTPKNLFLANHQLKRLQLELVSIRLQSWTSQTQTWKAIQPLLHCNSQSKKMRLRKEWGKDNNKERRLYLKSRLLKRAPSGAERLMQSNRLQRLNSSQAHSLSQTALWTAKQNNNSSRDSSLCKNQNKNKSMNVDSKSSSSPVKRNNKKEERSGSKNSSSSNRLKLQQLKNQNQLLDFL